MRPIIAALLIISILFIGSASIAPAQASTATPTPTNTGTPTSTPTITPTADLYAVMTLESGQAVAIVYVVTAGQAAIGAELLLIMAILLFGIFLALRRMK